MIAGPHNDCINHLFQSMQFFADILVVEGVGLIGILKPGASALLFCADCVTREIYECSAEEGSHVFGLFVARQGCESFVSVL